MKNIMTIIIAAAMLLTGGCSLAQPAPESKLSNDDRLVGVMVTTEYLDLFDMEAWLNDNINQLNIGGTTKVSGDTTKYEGRIYAEQVLQNELRSDGSTYTSFTWEFPESMDDIIGGMFLCPTVTDPETGEQYTHSVVDGVLSDPKTHIRSTDFGNSTELSCTVYFDPYSIPTESFLDGENGVEMEHIAFYTNPVYQTPDGDIYVTSGMGNSYSVEKELGMDSFHSSSTLTDSQTTTINGEATTSENKVTVHYQGVRIAQSITVLEMSDTNKVVGSHSYTSDRFPNEIKVKDSIAYVIVETVSIDSDGNEIISRQICSTDHPDEFFEVFIPAKNGYAVKQATKVITE